MGNRRRVAERRKTKPAVVGGLIAVVVGGGAFGAYSLYGGGASAEDRTSETAAHKAVKTGPPSAAEVTALSTRFLTAWQSGDVAKAAAATDDSAAATTLLTGYGKDAHITGVKLTPGTPSGSSVPSPSRPPSRTRARASPWRTTRS